MMTRFALAALLATSLTAAACGSSTSTDGGTTTTTDTTAGGEDAISDTTGGGNDTTGSDAKADAGKDVQKADVGTPKATWGECQLSDQACMQGCVQSSCGDANQACATNSECMAFQDCISGCQATPIKLPEQATPEVALPGEDTQSYCFRVCEDQASPAALALDQNYITCVIGFCMDCSAAQSGITTAQCKQSCGQENYCGDATTACLEDTDCLGLYGCLLKCPQGDQACQTKCQTDAKGQAVTLFTAFNTCLSKNTATCVAP